MKNVWPVPIAPEIGIYATESIDVLVKMEVGAIKDESDEWLLAAQRLRLRCILADPRSLILRYNEALEKLGRWGWDMRIVGHEPSMNCVIVDHREVLLNTPSNAERRDFFQMRMSNTTEVTGIQGHFDKLWERAGTSAIVYEDLLASSIPELAIKIVTASKEDWDRIITYLARHPQDLRSMHPHKFEELVAELLLREGMQVKLTQRSKDGGRDIFAWHKTSVGPHLYLVECKRYSPEKPVGVLLVRALYGVVTAEKATGGLLITTSRFTRGARAFQETVQNHLWLKDYDALVSWMARNVAPFNQRLEPR